MSENELPTVCFADSPLWEGALQKFSATEKGSLPEGAGTAKP